MSSGTRLDRRAFLAASLAGSAFVLSCKRFGKPRFPITVHSRTDVPLNAWIVIGADDVVTFLVDESEMGQGVLTALSMVLAEELGAAWSQVRAENAVCDPSRYGYQGTAASTSIREQEPRLRKVGAAARAMLKEAAARAWGVSSLGLDVVDGEVIDPLSGRRARFGTLAAAAAKLEPPDAPQPLAPEKRWLTGTSPPRLDVPDKIRGRAVYGLDVRRPGQWFAAVARPRFGATVTGFDASAARQVGGVREVVQIPSGVAVLADNTWAALQGRSKVMLNTDRGEDSALDDAGLAKRLAFATKAGKRAFVRGRGREALMDAPQQVKLGLTAPLLAHACLEPPNATASVSGDFCEMWAPTQAPTAAQWAAAEMTGLDDSQVLIHPMLLGGGFGRKGKHDFIEEAAALSHQVKRPVQVVFDRADDLTRGNYRPCARCDGGVGLDATGRVTTLTADLASAPIFMEDGVDPSGVEGFKDLIYGIEHVDVRWAPVTLPIPVGFWRSVGSSQNAFFLESLLDAAARAAKRDPLEVRLELLTQTSEQSRLRKVLVRAAEMANWGRRPPEGRAYGLAAHACFGTYVAQVAEVSLQDDRVRVHRVFCAFDCGPVLHPDMVKAQVEGGIVFGLSAALFQAIQLEDGNVLQQNFDGYPLLRFDEMPDVQTDVLTSSEAMGGVGEPATPPIAPAVAAAITELTGTAPTSLPLKPRPG